jgi:hypothetical protein
MKGLKIRFYNWGDDVVNPRYLGYIDFFQRMTSHLHRFDHTRPKSILDWADVNVPAPGKIYPRLSWLEHIFEDGQVAFLRPSVFGFSNKYEWKPEQKHPVQHKQAMAPLFCTGDVTFETWGDVNTALQLLASCFCELITCRWGWSELDNSSRFK